jgi:polyketide biosynthesis enoyl-CoA hydratase PksI
MSERFALTPISGGVFSFRIASENEAHFDLASLRAFSAGLASIAERPDIRAVVLEGTGAQFCAGASREVLLGEDAARVVAILMSEIPRQLLAVPVPTVAALAGHAVGGGLTLGLWCDVAILAETALYGASFVDLGITPGMGSTIVLAEVFGPAFARELMLTGRLYTGEELRDRGGFSPGHIAPRANVRDRASALAEEIAGASAAAVRALKAHLARERLARLELALAEERTMHAELFRDPATRARIRASYPVSAGTRSDRS